ncbi:MAG: molecular chaperone HtpG [Anaerolineaceae bacterium]|jgi:molecular chaperone HtpG|nr:molecular chaperone HtpG [Anaerolineaceae bacterium]
MATKKPKSNNTHQFKAETRQLLNILIHSLYTDRDIFLRELISNASDAISRLNFELLTNKNVLDADVEPKIVIKINKDEKTITISDTGVGMDQDEIMQNLGTIAHSGAREFLEAAANAGESDISNIIGQFGVGFYSAFMVSDKIEVRSRSYDKEDEPIHWISDGGETYTIEKGDKEHRGTDIILHLKEDATEYLEEYRIRQIIKKHSDYIPYPIYLNDSEEQVNRQTAIWRQQPHLVKPEEYKDFYNQFTLDFNEPIGHLHLSIDAPIQMYGLLYIPSTAEPSLFSERKDYGLKLYARKVMIQEFTKDLLPEFLRFIQGVVDSEDIPLNVSREAFQSTKSIAQIKKILSSKVLDYLESMKSNEPEKYDTFWKEFGFFIKEGLASSAEYDDQLLALMRVKTTNKNSTWQSLDDYVQAMVADQKKIYYIIAEDQNSALNSPHLEIFKQQELDVITFTDPIDPFVLMRVNKYKDYDLVNVTSKDLDLPEKKSDEKKETDKEEVGEAEMNELLTFFKTTLNERIKEVRTTKKLVESPVRLVDSEGSPSPEMQKAYRYLQKDFDSPQRILEINPSHPIIKDLSAIKGINPVRELVIEQLYENALIAEGVQPNSADLVKRVNKIIEAALKNK